jgi:hypothetical protein
MISKIKDIEGKSFGANAPDYMYKKYLELSFDFTIQAISGTDLNKIRRVFKALQQQLPLALSSDFASIPCTLDLYEVKLDKFKNDVLLQNIHGRRNSQFTIFVEFPETMLTIDQQRSFVKDHLAILKEHLDVKKTKNVLMFIVTNSPIILTDVLGENVLFFNLSASETTYYSKRKTFNSNIIDVISKYRVSGINAEVASQVVSSIIKQCNQNKNIPKEEIDSIGDEFIYNYIQNCSNIYDKNHEKI